MGAVKCMCQRKTQSVILVSLMLHVSLVVLYFATASDKYHFPLQNGGLFRSPRILLPPLFENGSVVMQTSALSTKLPGLSQIRTSTPRVFAQQPLWTLDKPYTIDIDKLSATSRNSDVASFFGQFGSSKCFLPGILAKESSEQGKCMCKANYFGNDCGIPGPVWQLNKDLQPTPRKVSRRVVLGTMVNHELEVTEIRLNQLKDIVDVFIILESNVSISGQPKPMFMYEAMSSSGFLARFWPHILHVVMWSFPQGYHEDGWKADNWPRTYVSQAGLPRIHGLCDDDLFLNFDADELIKPEVVLFLKLYDGYPELIRIYFRWTLYAYFWQMIEHNQVAVFTRVAGCSVGLLRGVLNSDAMQIRTKHHGHLETDPDVRKYAEAHNRSVAGSIEMKIGEIGNYAGHHCSWCFSPEGIRLKLLAKNVADGPRYDLIPQNVDVTHIQHLIDNGEWFDGTRMRLSSAADTPDFAPAYVLANADKYKHILVHRQREAPVTTKTN